MKDESGPMPASEDTAPASATPRTPASARPRTPASPTAGRERIETLDVLRGFAVLGILVMNIGAFADIGAAYLNPLARGVQGTADWIVWTTNHLLADMKFMTLFSVLFGAGIALFAGRAEARSRKPAGLHYRRMFWLWLIGMVHAYVFWWGDILVSYAVCGSVAFLLRRKRPRTLAIVAGVLLLLPSLGMVGFDAVYDLIPPEIREQIDPEIAAEWSPDQETIDREIAAYRGSWTEQMPERAETTFMGHLWGLTFFLGPRVTALMLLGLALFKLDVITGAAGHRVYRTLMAVGWPLGLGLIAAGLVYNHQAGFQWRRSMLLGMQFNYWGSLLVAAAYLGLIATWVRSGSLPALRSRLGAVGRMAFTNYLAHTLVFTTIFYGHGLGLYAAVPRWQQALMVAAMFALQLWLSPLWLRRFRFGPLEWLWRSLTYWRRQPLRRDGGGPSGA